MSTYILANPAENPSRALVKSCKLCITQSCIVQFSQPPSPKTHPTSQKPDFGLLKSLATLFHYGQACVGYPCCFNETLHFPPSHESCSLQWRADGCIPSKQSISIYYSLEADDEVVALIEELPYARGTLHVMLTRTDDCDKCFSKPWSEYSRLRA